MRSSGFFNRLSIAARLSAVTLAALFVLFSAAIVALTNWLSNEFIRAQMTSLAQINAQTVQSIAIFDGDIKSEIARLGSTFKSELSGDFELREGERIAVGGASTPALYNGGRLINNNEEIVDRWTQGSGAVATIFAREGDGFVRVTSSLKKQNGERAHGTRLAADSPALAALLANQTYTGDATLFGREYITTYIPVTDAGGKVVGALFVGLDFTESLKSLQENISAMKFGKTGYMFVVSSAKNDAGTLAIHPTEQGKNAIDYQDADGEYYVKKIVEQKNGEIEYDYQPVGESRKHQKYAAFKSYPEWDWIVVSTIDGAEIAAQASVARTVCIVGAIVLIAALFALISLLLNRWLTKPLKIAIERLEQIAGGKMDIEIPTCRDDEAGKLLNAMRLAAAKLREALIGVRDGAIELSENAAKMLETSNAVAKSSIEQSDSAASMAASAEEMSANIDSVAQHAKDAAARANEADAIAQNGAKAVVSASDAMKTAAETTLSASKSIGELGERGKAVGAIVNMIGEIADQTNLLALNAAIEAARAGDQGRGFAVVADEVRKLAERTQSSAQEIAALIERIIEGTNDAATRMNAGVEQVERGASFAREAGAKMTDIRSSAALVSEAIDTIAHALDEQTGALRTVSASVESVSTRAEQNSLTAQKSAEIAKRLQTLSATLLERIGKFSV